MSIDLKGSGHVSMHGSSWDAVREIAREFGWELKYESRTEEERGPGDYGEVIPQDNARALAKALYKAIHEIETDCMSKRLVKLVREAQVGHLRAVADLAVAGSFYVD